MSILVNTPSFVNTPSTQAFQDWFSNNPTYLSLIQTATNNSFPVNVQIKIKDIIGTSQATGYTAFRLKANKIYSPSMPSVDWLSVYSLFISSHILNTSIYKSIENNNIIDDLTLVVNNFSLLNIGVYTCNIVFSIEGRTAQGGIWTQLSTYSHNVQLSVYEFEPITWDQENFILNYYQGLPKPEKVITMSGPNWTIQAPLNFILESLDSSVTISTQNSPFGVQYIATGSGTKQIKIKITDYWDSSEVLTPGTYSLSCFVLSATNTFVGGVSFTLNVLTPGNFFTDKTELYFEALFGGEQPQAIDVFTFSQNVFTIEAPYWLSVVPTSQPPSNIYSNISVVPINSENLVPGIYTGDIILSTTIDGQINTISISVVFNLFEFISFPYSQHLNNFTKDPFYLNFFTLYENTFFDVIMNVEVFDWFFQGASSKNYTIPFKILLFNKKQKENIGERIEKLLAKFIEPNLYATKLYNAANVSLEIKEKNYTTLEIIRESTLNGYKFLSGITPSIRNENNAILELSNGSKKITPNSFDYLNLMLSPGTNKAIEIIKNGESVDLYPISSDYDTYKETIYFENYNLKPGDIVEVKIFIDQTNTSFLKKIYTVFPKSEFSKYIIWEDDFKMMQIYEFTGNYTVKADYNYQNFVKKKNLIDYVYNFNTKDTQKIIINTGFIPKEDIIYINNIIKANRVWLYVSDDLLIELYNETKSIILDDNDRELIYFDLEFSINKKYNEESNSF